MPRVEANGVYLYYELHGHGPPLALIEGIGYATWMWFRQIDALAARHRLLVYDNRGVGQSDKPKAAYTVRDMADDLAALLEATGIGRSHLLGVSSGGFVAMEFALAYPERTDRLVLASTAPFGDADRVSIPEETRRLMVPDQSLPLEQRIRKAMAPAFAPGYAEARPEVVEAFLERRLAAPPQPIEDYVRQAQANAAFDGSSRLGAITAPTLVLHGDQDRVVPVENGYRLAEQLPHAELVILSGGGHLALIEQAERFNRHVLDFLQ